MLGTLGMGRRRVGGRRGGAVRGGRGRGERRDESIRVCVRVLRLVVRREGRGREGRGRGGRGGGLLVPIGGLRGVRVRVGVVRVAVGRRHGGAREVRRVVLVGRLPDGGGVVVHRVVPRGRDVDVRLGRRARDGDGLGRRVGERRRRERGLHERGRLDGTTTVHRRRRASHRASGSGEGDGRPGTHRGRRGRPERPGVVGIVHLRLRELRLRHVATHVSGRRARMSPARSNSSAQTSNRCSATCFFETAVFFDDLPSAVFFATLSQLVRRVRSRASSSPNIPPQPSSRVSRLASSLVRGAHDVRYGVEPTFVSNLREPPRAVHVRSKRDHHRVVLRVVPRHLP